MLPVRFSISSPPLDRRATLALDVGLGFLVTGLLLGAFLFSISAETATARSTRSGAVVQHSMSTDSIYSIASTRYTYEWVSGRSAWQSRELSLEVFLSPGVLVTDLVHQRRFGRGEFSGAAHYWRETWGDSYLHAHGSLAPNALTTARLSLGGELYEVINDWELSGWYEWRSYADTDVNVLGPQVGYYLGRWYLRLRTSAVERSGTWAFMQMAAARYQLGSSDAFVEGQIGYGRKAELVAARPTKALQLVQSYFGSIRTRYFFSELIGASASLTYNNASFRRVSGSAGLLVRW